VPGPVGPETISGDDLIFLRNAAAARSRAAAQLGQVFLAREQAEAVWDMTSGIIAAKYRCGPYDTVDDTTGRITRVAQQGVPLAALAPADPASAGESAGDTGSDVDVGELSA
jgi:hypothetical protein